MQAAANLMRPTAQLLPGWLLAEKLSSFVLVSTICFLLGAAVRTTAGRAIRERIEKSLLERLPGYALFRCLTQQLAGRTDHNVWKPALAEMSGGLRPGFV